MRRIALTALSIALLASAAHAATGSAPGVVLVRWRGTVRAAERAAVQAGLGATHLRDYAAIGVEKLALSSLSVEEAVLRLAQDPRVEFVEPDYLVGLTRTPDDPRFAEQWALHNTGQTGGVAGADARAVRGWDLATDASAVVVGVVDTGADLTHPDLVPNLWANPGEVPGNGVDDDANGYIDDVHGYDFLNGDGDPSDDNGHGSHVAGIIAARGDDALGVTGIAWRGRVMVLKFLGSGGNGPTSAAIEAMLYAARMGARVVNHSWGGGPYSQALVAAFAACGDAGVVSVVAAGNLGVDLEVQPVYPASFDDPSMITVAATDAADGLAAFSNRGAVSVDVAAPGVQILSLAPGAQYQWLSGTSMASPLVAGAVALLIAHEPTLDPVSVRQRLIRSVWPLPSLQGRTVSGGRLDLVRLLATPEDEAPSAITDLRIERVGSHGAWITWTAPGDDGVVGRADRYLLRLATGTVGSVAFESMTPVPAPEPSVAGTQERVRIGGLDPEQGYWVALRAMDDHGNGSPTIATLAFTTQPPPRAQLDVTTIAADLPPGADERRELLLTNPSSGTLEWRFASPRLVTGGDAAAASGGYHVVGLDAGPSPRFDWQPPGAEAVVVALEGDEGLSAPLALPFAFPYFGGEYRAMRVSSNGFITFTGEEAAPQPVALPSPLAPRTMVAPFWADLDPGPSARRVWMQADPLRVVITWLETRPFGSPGVPLTFQVWLMRTGEVRFQYLTLSGRSSLAASGLQGGAPSAGLGLTFRGDRLHDSLAVRFVPPREWARALPAAGVLGPGEQAAIAVDFASRGLEDGIQQDTLRLQSDDPAAPEIAIAVRLTARSAPHVVASHTWLDFGVRPLAGDAVRVLGVANEGARPARVHGVSVQGEEFAADAAGFDLSPGEARSVAVHFRPTRRGEQNAVLSLTSDDPLHPRTDVALAGEGLEPASVAVSRASVHGAAAADLLPGAERDEQAIVIANPGGLPAPWRLTAHAESRPQVDASARPAEPASSGGPDPAGYRWVSSEEPGAPAFEWWEIEGVGRRLFGAADDSVHVGIPLPFAFPYYGREFGGISVCTNGWLSFESSVPLREGVRLPDPTAPLGLIAPFWTDLDARNAANQGGVFAHSDARRFVVEWKDVRRFGGSERFSFQVWLWIDGRIDFLYRTMAGPRSGATIGMQDADGARGLTVSHGTAFARDSLRLSFRSVPAWLTASRYEGLLPPGGSDTLRVGLDAAGLPPGRWAGELRFALGTPGGDVVSLPCSLQAGARATSVAASQRRLVAASQSRELTLEWDGAVLTPTGFWIDDEPLPAYSVEALPGGRSRVRADAAGLLARLPDGDRVRRLAWRDAQVGWRIAEVPLEVVRLPLDATGLPAEGAPATADPMAGEAATLTWPAPTGATRSEAWLRTAPATWERIASGEGGTIAWRWPREVTDSQVELLVFGASELAGVWRSSRFSIRPAVAPPPPARLALAVAGPHPARAPVTLDLAMPQAGEAVVDVFDLRGARVQRLAQATFVAGRHPLVWDGRDASGSRAAAGVYLLRVRAGGSEVARRVVLLAGP